MVVDIALYWFGCIIGGTFLIGMIIGQLSVWRRLRKEGRIRINEWVYEASKLMKAGPGTVEDVFKAMEEMEREYGERR